MMTEPVEKNSVQSTLSKAVQSKTSKQPTEILNNETVKQSIENQHVCSPTVDQPINNHSLNDPVTKAVVDNIMGNLPTKKPFFRCDDCDLSFTSHAVLDAHLQGARHAKQIRTIKIMATLDKTKVAFTKDLETNGLMCNVCNVRLNSMQQLQTHLNGNRHKKKALRGGWQKGGLKPDIPAGGQKPSSSSSIIAGALFSVSKSCKVCSKSFASAQLLKKHNTLKKHIERVKLLQRQEKKKSIMERQKARVKTKTKKNLPRSARSEIKEPLTKFFVSSGFIHNGDSDTMSNAT